MEYNKTQSKLIDLSNRAIAELVKDKNAMQKAYNYYNGKRDAELFRYLEENFGIGNATSVEFTPLIKKHVDALLGEYLGSPILPKVSCKDTETISKITRDKLLEITSEVMNLLNRKLHSKLLEFLRLEDTKELVDPYIKDEIDRLVDQVNTGFVSKFEVAALNVIKYIIQSRQTDIQTKLRLLFLDLLITGWNFFRVKKTVNGDNILIEVLDPLNTFIDVNPDSPYVKDSYRCVIRKWMTKSLILNKYGKDLNADEKKSLEDAFESDLYHDESLYVLGYVTPDHHTLGMINGEVALPPGMPRNRIGYGYSRLIPVYEIEWLETDKDYVMQRYETVRIGDDIWILYGMNKSVQRSISNPSYCGLSLNGVYFNNRSDAPFSLVEACMSLLDRYDLLIFYRDSIIANSGTVGDFVDVSLLPKWLGSNVMERLQKYIAYKKQGLALIDTSLEGRLATGLAQLNTIFNGYDDTVKALAIQAIQMAIESIEQTMSSITGVFRERLNGIETKDAVTNIKIGLNNSFVVSKHWYLLMDLVLEELLTDSLNIAKLVYKNGLTGTLILGEMQCKVFTALPEHFTVTDFDVHITANSEIVKDIETIKQIAPLLILAQVILPDCLMDVLTAKSLSDAKLKILASMLKLKQEADTIGKLQEQLLQSLLLMQELEKLAKQLQSKVELLNEQKMALEKQLLEATNEIEWFKARTDRLYKLNEAKNDDVRTLAEISQLNDGNPNNDTIRQLHN